MTQKVGVHVLKLVLRSALAPLAQARHELGAVPRHPYAVPWQLRHRAVLAAPLASALPAAPAAYEAVRVLALPLHLEPQLPLQRAHQAGVALEHGIEPIGTLKRVGRQIKQLAAVVWWKYVEEGKYKKDFC